MNFLRNLVKDWTFLGLVVVSLSLVASIAFGRLPLSQAVVGLLLALWVIVLLVFYARLLELRNEIKKIRISSENVEVSEDVSVISMEDFIYRESRLGKEDSVLLFANTLDYDRKYFVDTIAQNLKKGVHYYYLMGGAESKRTWMLFLADLKERGVKEFPKGRFNTLDITPLLWTTAVYEYKDPGKPVEAISILEHQYDSNACIELSETISRRMREHFWEFWNRLESQAHDSSGSQLSGEQEEGVAQA